MRLPAIAPCRFCSIHTSALVSLLTAGLLFVAGCESGSTPNGSAPRVTHAKTTPDADDILPPQSEPLVEQTEPEATETSETPAEPAAKPRVLFDGTSLDHWKRSNFGGEGEVELVDGAAILQRGADLTGIHWTGDPLPKINYEVTLEAQRIDGSDFFCGIVFPVNDAFCSFVAGGWGGSTIGLSSVDDIYAAENETGTYASFEDKTWYKFKLRVSDSAISAWIDDKQYVYLKTKDRKLSVHPAVEPGKPFGVSAFSTVAGIRDIQIRELTPEEIAAEAKLAAE